MRKFEVEYSLLGVVGLANEAGSYWVTTQQLLIQWPQKYVYNCSKFSGHCFKTVFRSLEKKFSNFNMTDQNSLDRWMHYLYDLWFDFALTTRYQRHVMNWLNKVHLRYQSAFMSQIRATVDKLIVTQRKDKDLS